MHDNGGPLLGPTTRGSALVIESKRVVVVIDPRSASGELGLRVARTVLSEGGHVRLLTFTTGPMSRPFHDRRDADGVPAGVAAGVAAQSYLEDIMDRLGSSRVQCELIDGQRAIDQIRTIVLEWDASGLVLPATALGLLGRGTNSLLAASSVPIAVMPRLMSAA